MTIHIITTGISALFLVLSFPTVLAGWEIPHSPLFVWIAFVPFLLATREASLRRIWFLSFLLFSLFFACQLATIETAIRVFGHFSFVTSLTLTSLLIFALSLYMAFLPWLSYFLSRKQGEFIIWFPVCYVSFEFFRTYIFPFGGFPWGELSVSQAHWLLPLQIVDVMGSLGLTFLIVWTNVFITEVVCHSRPGLRHAGINSGGDLMRFPFKACGNDDRRTTFFLQKCAVTLLLFLFCFGYGHLKIRSMEKIVQHASKLRVALLQGNLSPKTSSTLKNSMDRLQVYTTEAAKVFSSKVDLIVWPEGAYSFLIPLKKPVLYNDALGGKPLDVSQRLPLSLVGAVTKASEHSYYNSALLYDARGQYLSSYHKTHLVPFGEYIPYRSLFPFLTAVTRPIGILLPGEEIRPLVVDRLSIGPLICIEDLYASLSRAHVQNGDNLLVNITNDGWYGLSPIPKQHLLSSVVRAVETRRSVLRAANTGVTALIDPVGRVLQQSPLNETLVIVGEVPLLTSLSTYVTLGDWFAWGCVLYLLFGIVFLLKMRWKDRSSGFSPTRE